MTAIAGLSTTKVAHPVLRLPLFGKLIGANAIIIAISAVLLSGAGKSAAPPSMPYAYFGLGALCVGVLINMWLVSVALRPIRELQRVAERVANGSWQERVRQFSHADSRIERLVDTTNQMLDRLAADRKRMKKLGAEVVYAQEEERALVARELHESVAQTLAAASFQLTGALASAIDKGSVESVKEARDLIGSAIEELQAVSHSLHPRVASDLGLPSALESLSTIVRNRSLIDVFLVTDVDAMGIPAPLAATLYRVAKEALHNVELRGDANSATIALTAREGAIELTIVDDGSSHPVTIHGSNDEEPGFRAAHERFSLAGGQMHIDRVPTGGTRVTARITTDRQAA